MKLDAKCKQCGKALHYEGPPQSDISLLTICSECLVNPPVFGCCRGPGEITDALEKARREVEDNEAVESPWHDDDVDVYDIGFWDGALAVLEWLIGKGETIKRDPD